MRKAGHTFAVSVDDSKGLPFNNSATGWSYETDWLPMLPFTDEFINMGTCDSPCLPTPSTAPPVSCCARARRPRRLGEEHLLAGGAIPQALPLPHPTSGALRPQPLVRRGGPDKRHEEACMVRTRARASCSRGSGESQNPSRREATNLSF